jgi:hypothetical protein
MSVCVGVGQVGAAGFSETAGVVRAAARVGGPATGAVDFSPATGRGRQICCWCGRPPLCVAACAAFAGIGAPGNTETVSAATTLRAVHRRQALEVRGRAFGDVDDIRTGMRNNPLKAKRR